MPKLPSSGASRGCDDAARAEVAPRLWLGLAAALTIGVAAPVVAQPPPQWFALDGSPPGTPPSIILMTGSNTEQTVLDITLHGFYYQDIVKLGQTFRRLSFDGWRDQPRYRAVGRPELPALHHVCGSVVGSNVNPPVIQVLNEVSIPGALIHPAQPARLEDGSPAPPFQWDQAFYQQTSQPYPLARGARVGALGRLSRIDLVAAETYPLRVVPATQVLLAAQHYQVTIAHPASPSSILPPPLTRRQFHAIQRTIVNGSQIQVVPGVAAVFAGNYLIVTDPAFVEEVEPLAEQKRSRGYSVTVATTEAGEAGNTCASIRDYIHDWWPLGSSDAYVLLVGDVAQVPKCLDENAITSDRVYACIDGTSELDGLSDPYAEVRLGRLPCGTESECDDMVTKTLHFEEGYSGGWYDDVALVAHQDEDFELAQEAVLFNDYSTPPTFLTLYARLFFDGADVSDEINAGKGVVCYRGLGLSDSWWNWTLADEEYDVGDVVALANGTRTPVVFSIASTNNWIDPADLATGDCIGEVWMKTTKRAVAHYGATNYPYWEADDVLETELFAAIYDEDYVILGEALAVAENAILERFPDNVVGAINGEHNAWMYLLLGDPELKIWREDPFPMLVSAYPVQVPPQPSGPTTFGGYVNRPCCGKTLAPGSGTETPVEFAIVTVYKPGDFVGTTYTDATGRFDFTVHPASPGVMFLTAYTDFESDAVFRDTIPVVSPVDVSESAAVSQALRLDPVRPNPFRREAVVAYTLPRPGGVRLTVHDLQGRRLAHLAEGTRAAGTHTASWSGRDAGGRRVAPGLYVLRLEFEGETDCRKVLMIE